MSLTPQQLERLRLVLAKKPRVRRALFVEAGERRTPALEYDERPASVDEPRQGTSSA